MIVNLPLIGMGDEAPSHIDGDSNCCFSVVAYGLLTMICHQWFFFSIGLQIEGNGVKIVSEHLKHGERTNRIMKVLNQQDYEGFVPGIDEQQEAMKFSESGYFLET